MNYVRSTLRRNRAGRGGWDWRVLDDLGGSVLMEGWALRWKTAQKQMVAAKRLEHRRMDQERKGHGIEFGP